jgi:glycosyltransferase involved in cell wall biosynthesis
MNILIFSWRGPGHPNAGGAEQVTHEHAKAWVKAGHNITLFTSSFQGAKKREIVDGIEIIRYGNQILGVHIYGFLWYVFRKHPKFDLVIDQFHFIPFFTPLFIKEKKLAFIHEVAKEVWKLNSLPFPRPLSRVSSFFGERLEPYLFRVIYKKIPFLTVSESTRDDLTKWGIPKTNITIVHNGVKLIGQSKIIPKEKIKTAIFLGALSKDKGIEDALKVFAEIERKDDSWQYWIVGKGSDVLVKFIRNETEVLGIKNKMKYWGFVNDPQKFSLLARSHILVNTSVREGWGLVNIEASSVGTPVVGYGVAGIRDSVKDGRTGILSEYGDVHSVAANTLKLVHDENLYKRYQKESISWSKNFTWEKAGKESLDLIESI